MFSAVYVPAIDFYQVEARKLDKFIYDHLQPNVMFLEQVRRAIDQICSFLKENCFIDSGWPRTRVLKIVKGGSSGKGTALKGSSDADLVVFLNVFESYNDQERDGQKILQEMEKRLKQSSRQRGFEVLIEPPKWENPRGLSFKFRTDHWPEFVECHVLPAYDALGQYNGGRPNPQVYIDLINSGGHREFSTCFVELQKDFIVARPPKLKSLIRLVKHWYKQLAKRMPLPPKYALELLAVYAWEQGSGEAGFNMAAGFRTVLWLIQNYSELCIFWTMYYDFENETIKRHLQSQLQKDRPIILDPADPTGNVAGKRSRWALLAEEAELCCDQSCCRNFDGSLVQPWTVPLRKGPVPALQGPPSPSPPPLYGERPGGELTLGAEGGVFKSQLSLDLYKTEARHLDKFIEDHLLPNKAFLEQVRETIHQICTFLKENCFKDEHSSVRSQIRVRKIVKGGSSGKGTALKGSSDADLVVFLDAFKSYADQKTVRKEILLEIKRRLKECSREMGFQVDIEPSKWENPRVLSFRFHSDDWTESDEFHEFVECDVLPAYDALDQFNGRRPDPQVYVQLIRSGCSGGEFSTCFTELQKDFIIDRPAKLKSLIRLVKHWYKQLPTWKSFPPKYALELLAVYAWEQGSGKTNFNMASGFRTVLWLIQNYSELCIFWTTYYDFENETIKRHLQSQLLEERPIILDPADPTGNVAGKRSRWALLAEEAELCCDQNCCRNFDGSLVQPWTVPVSLLESYVPQSYPFLVRDPDPTQGPWAVEGEGLVWSLGQRLKLSRSWTSLRAGCPPRMEETLTSPAFWEEREEHLPVGQEYPSFSSNNENFQLHQRPQKEESSCIIL